MRTGILLSYVGLGSNLLHLTYCHEIAKKYVCVDDIIAENVIKTLGLEGYE